MGGDWTETGIPDVLERRAFVSQDSRGSFAKVWVRDALEPHFSWDEMFYSVSHQGTVRGMHVQANRSAGRRVVFVTRGMARDFVLDLRKGSPSYGCTEERLLKPGGRVLMIPPGCAHGFEALADDTTMVYLQEGLYDGETDIGVLWSSVGIKMNCEQPIVSDRDKSLPALADFETPFLWSGDGKT